MGNKKKENIQVEFKTRDYLDEDSILEDEFVYKISYSKSRFFDVHTGRTEIPNFVTRFPIQDIFIEGSLGFDQITLRFGEFGHIHLDMEEAKVFLDGFEKVYKGLVEMNDEIIEME